MNKEEFTNKWGHLFSLIRDLSSFRDEEQSSEGDDIRILMLRDAISVIEDGREVI